MEPILFVMAILGCGEGDAVCQPVRLADARYESRAECLAATEAELLRVDDVIYPNIVAQCRPAGAEPQLIRGTDVLMPEPEFDRALAPRYASADPRRSGRD